MSEEDEIELQRLKQNRMLEARRKAVEDDAKTKYDAQKQATLRIVLTPEARDRLNNIRMVKPEFADQLEQELIRVAQTGRLKMPVGDEQLREILGKITPKKREITIRRI